MAPKFDITVGRNTLADAEYNAVAVPASARTQAEAEASVIRAPAPQPTPRFTGAVGAVKGLRGKGACEVRCCDYNVVGAAELWARGRGAGVVERVKESGDTVLLELVEMLDAGELEDMQFIPQAPFGRLNIHAGEASAVERLGAVLNCSFCIYPCPDVGSEDAWEVRYAAPGGRYLRYERFLEYGLEEARAYVKRCVLLGQKTRLSVARLVRDDPLVFWVCVFRYKLMFNLLADESGDTMWREDLRDAVHLAAASSKSNEFLNMSWQKLEKLVTSSDGRTRRQEIAESGFMAATTTVPIQGKVRPANTPAFEMSETMRSSRLGIIMSHIGSSANNIRSPAGAAEFTELLRSVGITDEEEELAASASAAFAAPNTQLEGQHALCAYCGNKEPFPGSYKLCSKCKATKYCSRRCQLGHWKGDHRKLCGAKETPEGYVHAVLLPGDTDISPCSIFVPPGTLEFQTEYMGSRLLNCASLDELRIDGVRAGEGKGVRGVILLSKHHTVGEVNVRASTVVTPPIASRTAKVACAIVDIGETNPNAKIRGDAILVRSLAVDTDASRMYGDFAFDDFKANYGLHSCAIMEGMNNVSNDATLQSSFPLDIIRLQVFVTVLTKCCSFSTKALSFVLPVDTDPNLVAETVRSYRSGGL